MFAVKPYRKIAFEFSYLAVSIFNFITNYFVKSSILSKLLFEELIEVLEVLGEIIHRLEILFNIFKFIAHAFNCFLDRLINIFNF